MTGADLRAWRERMGWLQREAAAELGYSRRQIVRWEQRPDEPVPYRMQRLARAIEAERARR